MPPGKHPAGIIFITLPQHEVDINVHPRKEEVAFLHPRLIEVAIENMVRASQIGKRNFPPDRATTRSSI